MKRTLRISVIDRFRGEYRFLSNFWPAEVVYHNITYPTVEHAYQAAKCVCKEDREAIAALDTPGKAKRYTRNVPTKAAWNALKLRVMRELIIQKFNIPELRQKLRDTGDALLIEGNTWHDNYWGQCFCPKCYGKVRYENWLGRILMRNREDIWAYFNA